MSFMSLLLYLFVNIPQYTLDKKLGEQPNWPECSREEKSYIARSPSLYRQSYPDSWLFVVTIYKEKSMV
jgi:hypothetical protein